MEKQMQQLSLSDTARDEQTKIQDSTSDNIREKDQDLSIPKSKPVLQKTREVLDERINELEAHHKKLSKRRHNLNGESNVEECANINLLMENVANQLNFMRELRKVHLTDVKKIKRANNKQKKKSKRTFVKLMEDFQRYKELLLLLQNAEVREAFRAGTNGAAKLSENELEYLCWLNAEINPSVQSAGNKTIWRKKLRESALKAVEITLGSSKEIISPWTGGNTKLLLERINKSGFFSGRTLWTNMAMFTRVNATAFSDVFQSHPYYCCYDKQTKSDADEEFKSNFNDTFSNKPSRCNHQSLNNNAATDRSGSAQAEKKAINTRENYKFVKRSDKPDDYYLCFNYYPARFTSDVKVPRSLARRPPPGIFRCDI
ncbi:unnamed protein product [Litomosoides sigmodontis]|uniref:Caprin-1 dimerization domain-containing protein n=1 Tax=Litomosoides sigmodontis TaxID=42156 RepID=A0A3P6SQT5_LITSI|nr:unnamed protein product [Litomosoides sigmodontis]